MGEKDIRSDGSTPIIIGEYISDDLNTLVDIKKELTKRLTYFSTKVECKWRFKLCPTDYKHTLKVYIKTYGEASPTDLQEIIH